MPCYKYSLVHFIVIQIASVATITIIEMLNSSYVSTDSKK